MMNNLTVGPGRKDAKSGDRLPGNGAWSAVLSTEALVVNRNKKRKKVQNEKT
jgi:hypothetical protein